MVAPVWVPIALRMSAIIEFSATIVSWPSANVTLGGLGGICPGVGGGGGGGATSTTGSGTGATGTAL